MLHPTLVPSKPFERIHVDHLGPFTRSSRGNVHLLVVVDALTKFVKLYPAKSTRTPAVIRALESFINDYGVPKRIVTDRGTCFTSTEFQNYCVKLGIHHTLNSSRHPQANGQVERVNRTLIPLISIYETGKNDWDKKIKLVEQNLNSSESKTTRKTPFECLYGYNPCFVDSVLRQAANVNVDYESPEKIREKVKENINREQLRYKERYDSKRYAGLEFEVGDIVVMKRAPENLGQPTKTQVKYRGPLVVIEKLPSDTYRVSDVADCKTGREYTTTAHVSQLKIYQNHEESESEDESEVREESTDEKKGCDHDCCDDTDILRETLSNVQEDPQVTDREKNPVRRQRRSKKPSYLDDYQIG